MKGLKLLEKFRADVVLLDIQLPDINGFEVYKFIRSNYEKYGNPIVIAISGFENDENIVEAYSLGCIDFIKKPLDFEVLCYKLGSIERLLKGIRNGNESGYRIGDVFVDKLNRRITLSETEIKLTKTEYMLFILMLENKGKLMNRKTIMNKVWNVDYLSINDRCIDMCIYRLKKKIPALHDNIESINGEGYRLRE